MPLDPRLMAVRHLTSAPASLYFMACRHVQNTIDSSVPPPSCEGIWNCLISQLLSWARHAHAQSAECLL